MRRISLPAYKDFIDEAHGIGEGLWVQPCFHMDLIKVTDHIFGWHIAGEFIFCHRASAVSFHRGIKPPATTCIRGFDLFLLVVRLRMQVCPKFHIRIGWDEIGEEVRDIFGIGYADRIG